MKLVKLDLPRILMIPRAARRLETMVTHRLAGDLGALLGSMITPESKLLHGVLNAHAQDMHLRSYSSSTIDYAPAGEEGKVVRNLADHAFLKPGFLPGTCTLPAAYALLEATLYPGKGPDCSFFYCVLYWDPTLHLWRSYNELEAVSHSLEPRLPTEIPALQLYLEEAEELHDVRPSLCKVLQILNQE